MTKQEILDALEGLKDFVNSAGKQSIDGIKAAIRQNLSERLELPLETVEAPELMVKAPKVEEEPPQEEFVPKNKPEKPKAKKAAHSKSRK